VYEHVVVLLMEKEVDSGRNADLHSGYASFESRLGYRSFLVISWFFSVPPSTYLDSTLHFIATASFHMLSKSLLILGHNTL
jgi:hypothetical protein